MTTRPTVLTLHAFFIGMSFDGMYWTASQGNLKGYELWRAAGWESIEKTNQLTPTRLAITLPGNPQDFLVGFKPIQDDVIRFLMDQRNQLLGDRFALPMFTIALRTRPAILRMAGLGGEPNDPLLVTQCVFDMGLGEPPIRNLAHAAGLLRTLNQSAPDQVDIGILEGAAGDFFVAVTDGLARVYGEEQELKDMVRAVRDEVVAFRAEFRATAQRFEELIRAGNTELTRLVEQIQLQMVASGQVDASEARQATTGDPKSLWERIQRWAGSGGPGNAVEGALWAALDFVPGGTGLKLGMAVVKAVAQSLKR